ncbi:hypothetical protein NLJ89_g6876 [Agrocybe chaxingu]|uniref:Uncharacterized protein n=1 Tax=Agrocybe chaxingu TaxID=84603 RepID=A0A9W8JXG4_9AGAR|nr:hypothetical protein NLJ89_g6876 [Agrocybe chaxingu]
MDSVGDIAISWTLGKMVLEASKEVPPLVKAAKPILDPIDDIENPDEFPIKPIRPPFLSLDGLEERITPHLPSSLSRNSLGFSPVLFLLYLTILVLLIIACPMRRVLRASCLRSVRSLTKRDSMYGDMEEGNSKLGNGRPPSPTSATFGGRWLYPVRRVFFGNNRPTPKSPLSVVTSNKPILRHMMPNANGLGNTNGSVRASPTRSFMLPAGGFATTASSTQYISRSPSPGPSFDDASLVPGQMQPQGSLMTSRSRNASQMNLSSMAPRPGAISRASSSYHVNGIEME